MIFDHWGGWRGWLHFEFLQLLIFTALSDLCQNVQELGIILGDYRSEVRHTDLVPQLGRLVGDEHLFCVVVLGQGCYARFESIQLVIDSDHDQF